ncbi:hypothetical protein [uncultured Pedobacter sp.]|uniref:hypothetical protein n=1 Tax=uncultured Pedobacter sp. TaxID=246139 RepID=UPI0025F2463D|nr:hypothetical protein [uncultured Pedobacter sp.]
MIGFATAAVLIVSGTAPSLLFGYLAFKKQKTTSGDFQHSGMTTLDHFLEGRFREKMNRKAVIQTAHGPVTGYFMMEKNGEFTFFLQNHRPIMKLWKSPIGWIVTKDFEGVMGAKEVTTSLILYLEGRLYN